jgi:RNA polymerase sigma factor (sigma-70 family)
LGGELSFRNEQSEAEGETTGRAGATPAEAARRRAAIELVARHERALRQTARRYSLCAEDAEDAYQRALEIVLTKAPTADPGELIRWTQTVTKHEAMAVRRNRERLLGAPAGAAAGEEAADWVTLIPAEGDGPPERAERREAVARSREALQALKPAELRALGLLAEGYSYAEIGELTGFSRTKINRCLAEGRERFRRMLLRSEAGERCEEMRPLLSLFCDGEAGPAEADALREHLRACAHCRATLRAYRAAPRAAAALAPTLGPASRSLLERAHEALAGLAARLPGAGGGDPVSQVAAAGGTRGAGLAALAKLAAICAGTAGGAAACVAAGVVPAPLGLAGEGDKPAIVRPAEAPGEAESGVDYETAPLPTPQPTHEAKPKPKPKSEPEAAPEPVASPSGAVEYSEEASAAPPSVPAPSTASGSSGSGSGSAAGEFGP